ncbi:hypothetical protein EYS42_09160 [Aquabacterium lacunae]|uniref:Uncharacterized protein n=1 Tax=Aquabacterium lacunae TaxID=2528630 RepID=A0A4Q9GZF0_9BURK|nr:hypothetical protein EYS42_09160 [Aquabacterium lacunae]
MRGQAQRGVEDGGAGLLALLGGTGAGTLTPAFAGVLGIVVGGLAHGVAQEIKRTVVLFCRKLWRLCEPQTTFFARIPRICG